MDEAITRRIHISGLTPAITSNDLSERLASFGTVKAIEGFGALDALGQPRKFVYATLQTTKEKLARCMNLLSGVIWKGTKLRIGEAKPDYRERMSEEQAELKRVAEEEFETSNKRRRLRGVQGIHSHDMSLVTPENVATRGGWRVTSTGRMIRPMRMRPLHPLPEFARPLVGEHEKGKVEKVRTKKRLRAPPSRARRRTIDPIKYGSQHLKGMFLENAAAFIPPARNHASIPSTDVSESAHPKSEPIKTNNEDSFHALYSEDDEIASPIIVASAATSPQPEVQTVPSKQTSNCPAADQDLVEEKKHTLKLLQALFGDADSWGGAESVESDGEINDVSIAHMDEEHTPIVGSKGIGTMGFEESSREGMVFGQTVPQQGGSAQTRLKDLFAPRQEDAGFSLLGHLELDLELENELPFEVTAPTLSASSTIQQPASRAVQMTVLDHTRPFFFPIGHGGNLDCHDPTTWRAWFYRTDTPEAIKLRWEEVKGELTSGWKRRHREAIKSRRRRGGVNGDAD